MTRGLFQSPVVPAWKEGPPYAALAYLAVITAVVVALSAPLFVFLKNRNDASIADSTKRIADALESHGIVSTSTGLGVITKQDLQDLNMADRSVKASRTGIGVDTIRSMSDEELLAKCSEKDISRALSIPGCSEEAVCQEGRIYPERCR